MAFKLDFNHCDRDDRANNQGRATRRNHNATRPTGQTRLGVPRKTAALLGIAGILSAIALIAGINLTVAAFSSNGFLKAVAATNEAANLLSSDLLATFGSEPGNKIPSKSVIVSDSDTASFTFSIFNYLQNDPGAWCQKDITYDLNVTVEGAANPASCTLNNAPFSDSTAALSNQKLAARQKSTNTYTITLPKSDVNTAVFKVFVTVTDAGGTTVRYLAANITPSQEATVQATSVSVSSADKTATNKPNDFDAYNYDVTLNGSQSQVTIAWNDDLVQLEPYFAEKHPGATVSATNHTVTLTMDPGTMRVNFYRREGKINDSTTWDNLGIMAAITDTN